MTLIFVFFLSLLFTHHGQSTFEHSYQRYKNVFNIILMPCDHGISNVEILLIYHHLDIYNE